MSVKPIDFLNCAREHAVSAEEIHKRNAISRSYYAAYHECISAFPYTFQIGESMHKSYIDYLLKCDVGTPLRRAGVILQGLHSRRVLADYHLDRPIPPSATAMQIAGTTNIFNLVSDINSSSAEA